jgi:pyridoxal phosphate enzyme (YggS family)
MDIKNNIAFLREELTPAGCRLIAVSKTQPPEKIMIAYEAGQRVFGENKAQEMAAKYRELPPDIEWHMIGHLQTNKAKLIAPFVALIQSIDSLRLLEEVDKQGKKNNRVIPCLLQVHIAAEDTKFGFDAGEIVQAFEGNAFTGFHHITIRGLMGIASLTPDKNIVRGEFRALKVLFDSLRQKNNGANVRLEELSMGMSADYRMAVEEGSTLVRIGSAIFGERINPT